MIFEDAYGQQKIPLQATNMELPDFNTDRMFNAIGKVTENTPEDVLGDPQGIEDRLFSMSLFQSFYDWFQGFLLVEYL